MKQSILPFIKQIKRDVFTSHDLSILSGKSISVISQSLNNLADKGVISKIYRGVWTGLNNEAVSAYSIINALFSTNRVYVSFISALHLHGIIEQIPQVITLASTGHSRSVRTKYGTYELHTLSPEYFRGFDWYKESGNFLIAQPEKALADSLYLSACRKNQYSHFPELTFPNEFSFNKLENWISKIPNPKIRNNAKKRLKTLLSST